MLQFCAQMSEMSIGFLSTQFDELLSQSPRRPKKSGTHKRLHTYCAAWPVLRLPGRLAIPRRRSSLPYNSSGRHIGCISLSRGQIRTSSKPSLILPYLERMQRQISFRIKHRCTATNSSLLVKSCFYGVRCCSWSSFHEVISRDHCLQIMLLDFLTLNQRPNWHI